MSSRGENARNCKKCKRAFFIFRYVKENQQKIVKFNIDKVMD